LRGARGAVWAASRRAMALRGDEDHACSLTLDGSGVSVASWLEEYVEARDPPSLDQLLGDDEAAPAETPASASPPRPPRPFLTRDVLTSAADATRNAVDNQPAGRSLSRSRCSSRRFSNTWQQRVPLQVQIRQRLINRPARSCLPFVPLAALLTLAIALEVRDCGERTRGLHTCA
jgi:hypothetical protein